MKSFTVGVSSSSIELSVNRGIIDGIGHYTEQLITAFDEDHIAYKKFAFPRLFKQIAFSDSIAMPHSFPVSMLPAIVTHGKLFKYDPKVDIFHCTDFRLIPMTCPTVMTLHDVMLLEHPEFGRNKHRGQLAAYFLQKSLQFSDHVIAISDYTAQQLVRYCDIKEDKISVVHLSADDAWFESIDEGQYNAVLKKYHLPNNYFLSVGTIQPKKNFGTLIDAYLLLPDTIQKEYPLVIVGKYGWNCDELLTRMQRLCEEKKIIWLSDISLDEELRCIYRGASVFVFPSLYEGFGIPLIEAFASHLPVICSDSTALPEISHGAAIEVDPASAGTFAEAMQLLVSNSAERNKHIKLGIKRALELRWSQTFAKTMSIYKKLLTRS